MRTVGESGPVDESEDGAVIEDVGDAPEGMDEGVDAVENDIDEPFIAKNLARMVIDKAAAASALADLKLHMKPKRNVKGDRYADPGFDSLTRIRLENMKSLLWVFVDPLNGKSWIDASLHVAHTVGRGQHFARKLREWTRSYISDRTSLPVNIYGTWSESLLDHEDLQQELIMHLQSIGKYVTADHLMQYMARADVKKRWEDKTGYFTFNS
jgi:hypothetical protein